MEILRSHSSVNDMIPWTLVLSRASGEPVASNSGPENFKNEKLFGLLVPAVGDIHILQNVRNLTSHHSIPESFFA